MRALCLCCVRLSHPSSGPKAYLATADIFNKGSTKLHKDMTSAINVMPVSSAGPGRGGAQWIIVPLDQVARLTEFLLARRKELRLVAGANPILDQRVFITADMLRDIRGSGIKVFSFTQCQNEAVYIPAGLPHQVCPLRRVPCMISYRRRSATSRLASRSRPTFCPWTRWRQLFGWLMSSPWTTFRIHSIRTRCCGTPGCR